ncbi:unnamed protein product [Urochloa humidicola]
MQQFPEGAHVRLRIRVHGGYLHTDEDGVRISLHRRGSAGAAWRVERVLHDEATCVLLHSTAYGWYLAALGATGPPRRPERARRGPHPLEARRLRPRRLRPPAPRLLLPPPRQRRGTASGSLASPSTTSTTRAAITALSNSMVNTDPALKVLSS